MLIRQILDISPTCKFKQKYKEEKLAEFSRKKNKDIFFIVTQIDRGIKSTKEERKKGRKVLRKNGRKELRKNGRKEEKN